MGNYGEVTYIFLHFQSVVFLIAALPLNLNREHGNNMTKRLKNFAKKIFHLPWLKENCVEKKLKVVFLSISSCQADFYILLKLRKLFFNRSFWKFQKIPRNTLVVKQSYKSAIPQFYSIALHRGVFLENFPKFSEHLFYMAPLNGCFWIYEWHED